MNNTIGADNSFIKQKHRQKRIPLRLNYIPLIDCDSCAHGVLKRLTDIPFPMSLINLDDPSKYTFTLGLLIDELHASTLTVVCRNQPRYVSQSTLQIHLAKDTRKYAIISYVIDLFNIANCVAH